MKVWWTVTLRSRLPGAQDLPGRDPPRAGTSVQIAGHTRRVTNPIEGRISSAVEDYLKAIYSLAEREDTPASTSRLAGRLGVSASTVSGMLRRLVELELVAHRPYGGVTLTEAGRAAALRVLRRHRLLETYLVSELGYGWSEVHDEAEILEHHISDTLLARIDARLDHPRVDPHGDPIPTEDGTIEAVSARRLSTLQVGERGRLVRVDDADPDMLRHLDELAVALDDVLELIERRPFRGPFVIRCHSAAPGAPVATDHELGPDLATAMWIDPDR